MQKLPLEEIRYRYKEKYEERLSRNNDELKKNMEGYRINYDGKHYFIEVQSKQEECEQIVDFLNVQKKEPDVVKKYHLLLQTLPENYRQEFPDTLKYHKGYTTYLINKRKNKSIQMVQSFKALKTMLSLMDKEIAAYSDEEMAELIKNKSFTATTKQHSVWFIKYIYNKAPEQFQFNVEMSMLRRETIRGEEDFYMVEEWAAFADVFFA